MTFGRSKIPTTDLSERCDHNTLGLSRLSRIPDVGFPPRDICRKFVTDDEVKKGTAPIAEYREKEQLALDNEVGVARQRIQSPECGVFEA